MSRSEMADAVNTVLARLYPDRKGIKSHYVDDRWVGKLERGEHHWSSAERRAALRTVTGAATDDEIGLYKPRVALRGTSADILRHLPQPTRAASPHDGDAAEPDRVAGDTDPGAPSNHIDGHHPDLDLVEFARVLDQHGISSAELTAVELACERLDHDFARTPPHELLAKVRMLIRHVSARLSEPQPLGHHERLVRLAARLAGLRAWACFDIDDHSTAERWYDGAVTAAQQTRAWGLGAWLLGAQSLIPWHRRDLGRTVKLIERGIYFASQGSDATTRAWLHALHARSHAGMGNTGGFEAAYALAQEAAEYSNERDRRHGMDFAHGALDLRYYHGTSRLLLQQPEKAEPELTGSLADLPESHTKARAVLSLFLADAAVQQDNIDEAVELTRQALTSTVEQPIMPILQQGRRIQRLVTQRRPAECGHLDAALLDFSQAMTTVASRANRS
ncbi:hypothetical protein [Actinoplanes sp. NPDC049599]|uniref:hypothetical protein n=1 Tax=Actinoplanes sp. NPDC049599 TaxID=3363903 RepID=UPI0037B4758B